jgi:hypothetical protein
LHELLQSKFGIFAGAQRLAALMNLMVMINKVSHVIYELLFHMEFFYEKRRPEEMFPKAFSLVNPKQWQIEPAKSLF